jgi:hypothetical protein
VSENGQGTTSQGVVDAETHISCSACGSALAVSAEFVARELKLPKKPEV